MPTISEMINKLIEQLKKDHDDETVPVLNKNRALFKDEYLDALIQTRGKTVDYDTAIHAIHNITDLPIDSIQAQINPMRKFKEGEIVEIPAERAETWIKRGIVEEVSELPTVEPANVESSEKIRVAAT